MNNHTSFTPCRSRKTAFSLVELLVVIGIISVLIGLLLPALRAARLTAEKIVCASNLRQVGNGLLNYITDNAQRFPLAVEPVWLPAGIYDFNSDPFDAVANPRSLATTLKPYLRVPGIYTCPSAVLGYPSVDKGVTYRISAANNYDAIVETEEQLTTPINYKYNLKYINGRKYRLRYVDASVFPFQMQTGVGPYYLLRDFVGYSPVTSIYTAPHNKQYNMLRLDMSISLADEGNIGNTYP